VTAGAGKIRYTAYFSGHVQGVGFRFTACRVAERYDVTGCVRNLPDGRVEMIAEGRPDQVRAFVEAVHRAMSGYVREVQTSESPATGEFADFGVAF